MDSDIIETLRELTARDSDISLKISIDPELYYILKKAYYRSLKGIKGHHQSLIYIEIKNICNEIVNNY